ncbi:HAD family hydrolase [Yeosuana marina]|uniref:HAD family hydrolase n=1 Tax=Yeosuana marina TaxID=1565536 RepID=UPI001421D24C|nr:HAD family hydrolase [Yeosuana marina]
MDTKTNTILIFDLDDTLYKEIDYLSSAYKEIASFISKKVTKSSEQLWQEMLASYHRGDNVFQDIIQKHQLTDVCIEDFITRYRHHHPHIQLTSSTKQFLASVKEQVFKVGLITDGRSVQQRHKLKALGLLNYFDTVVISEEFGSEKPNKANFKYFEDTYGINLDYIYVGDNTAKDFIAPNTLGWQTFCLLDDGRNIHKQSFDLEPSKYPNHCIRDLSDIAHILPLTYNPHEITSS